MPRYRVISRSPGETRGLGEKLGTFLQGGEVIALWGDLGSGKTLFVQGTARGLGVEDYVTSPTFILINQYQGRVPLYHFDVYRLEEPEELLELGHEEYFYGEGVTLIEWAGKIEGYLPEEYLKIILEPVSPGDTEQRVITFHSRGSRYHRLLEKLF